MTKQTEIIWVDKWGHHWPSKDEYLEYVENHPNYEKKAVIDERTDSKQSEPDIKVIEKTKKKPFVNCFGITMGEE